MSGHTQRVTMSKCQCGDSICKQYTLSTQGSVGFDEADARLYTAAPDMLDALRSTRNRLYNAMIVLGSSAEFATEGCREADAAIARAEGRA